MEALVITSLESAAQSLGDLLRSSTHAVTSPAPHIPGVDPAVITSLSSARTAVTTASQDDFPGTAIDVSDYQIIDFLPSSDRPVGSFYLIDSKTYKVIRSNKSIVGSKIVLYQHLARETQPEGFSWS